LFFVLRKRLENRRLPITHTRDWRTNLKGQDLFSKLKRTKKKKHTQKIKKIKNKKKNQQNIKNKKEITKAAFPGLISARRTKVISKKQLRVSIAHTDFLKKQTKTNNQNTC